MKLAESDAQSRTTPVVENIPAQQRLWRTERVGLWLMLAMVLLTLLGLFSKGPLSSRQVSSANGELKLEYERFVRNGATSTLVVDVQGKPDALVTVTFEGELLEGATVESITPTEQQAATYRGTGLQLQVHGDAQGRARLHLAIRADGVGPYRSAVMAAGQRLGLNQFIYP